MIKPFFIRLIRRLCDQKKFLNASIWLLVEATLVICESCGGTVSSPAPVQTTSNTTVSADIVVYGATPSGIMASIEASRLGKTVVLLEPTQHVGGLMSNGLGATDLYGGTYSGLPLEFFKKVSTFYGGAPGQAAYTFEPHAAEQIFNSMLGASSNITVVLGVSLSGVEMAGTKLTELVGSNGVIYQGNQFIDSTYTGDLIAAAHVSYTVGREPSSQYNESLAGVTEPYQIGSVPISPYVVPGNSASGLIPHVFANTLGAPGSGDSAVMAYNYRLCVSSESANQIPFTAPPNYDSSEFELLGRLAASANPAMTLSDFLAMNPLPNHKFDLNNAGPMSTDEVEESFDYPDGTTGVRQKIEAEQKRYMLALLYFLQTDSRIPATVRDTVKSIGLCKDEFTDNGGWPRQIYAREARRMIGTYVMTQANLNPDTAVPDSIGLGGYNIDDHFEHVVNINGAVFWDSKTVDSQGLYQIPYRILMPPSSQATNLLSSVAVSASHVAFASLRVELTYMIMGQAAGAAASLAINDNSTVQDLSYPALGAQLASGGVITSTQNFPKVVSVSPSSGTSDTTQVFSALYSDPNGISDLSDVRILFNTSVDGVSACYVYYYPASNAFYLENDGDSATIGPLTPGSTSSISNSQCKLYGAGSSITASGNNLTVNFAIAFTNAFTGLKKIYMWANGASAASGWFEKGSWTPLPAAPPSVVSLSPTSGAGLTQTFTGTYSDHNGIADISDVSILFNTAVTGLNACYVHYYPATNALYLRNNADTGLIGPLTPGSTSSISNSQCTVNGGGSSAGNSGDDLTVNYAITFASTFTGLKNTYLSVSGASRSSGWVEKGSWTPAPSLAPTVVSVSPASGTGLTQTFTGVYSDPIGINNLSNVRILFNTAVSGLKACYVYYYPASNALYLENSDGTGTVGPLTPGTNSSISNSQCTINGGGSSVTNSPGNLTVNYAVTFASTFTGLKNTYLLSSSSSGDSGWVKEGTWTP